MLCNANTIAQWVNAASILPVDGMLCSFVQALVHVISADTSKEVNYRVMNDDTIKKVNYLQYTLILPLRSSSSLRSALRVICSALRSVFACSSCGVHITALQHRVTTPRHNTASQHRIASSHHNAASNTPWHVTSTRSYHSPV